MDTFIALEVAHLAAAASFDLVKDLPRSHGLRDQLERAGAAVPLHVAEASGRRGAAQKARYETAYGEAREAHSAVRVLRDARLVDPDAAAETLDLWDRSKALLWRLRHPRRR